MLQFYDIFGDLAIDPEPIRAPVEGNHGIVVTDVGLKRRYLVRCNIRWVRDDQIQGARAAFETTCRNESDALPTPSRSAF